MSDIRHSLLRRDALSAAKEALYHLDIYFSSQLQNVPLPIVDKGPVELLEEFVFQVPKERSPQAKAGGAAGGVGQGGGWRVGGRAQSPASLWARHPSAQAPHGAAVGLGAQATSSPPPLCSQRLNSLQELQLLEIMCSYFQEQSKDSVRQVLFSALFSPQGNKADDGRMALLGKLVSMAVAVCRVPVLECAASWLQVRGRGGGGTKVQHLQRRPAAVRGAEAGGSGRPEGLWLRCVPELGPAPGGALPC